MLGACMQDRSPKYCAQLVVARIGTCFVRWKRLLHDVRLITIGMLADGRARKVDTATFLELVFSLAVCACRWTPETAALCFGRDTSP